MIYTKAYEPIYLQDVIRMSERSDSTRRTNDTWVKNDLTAVLGFEENQLIGMLPLEKRVLQVSPGNSIDLLWVTGAHVEAERRSAGIGTIMDESIKTLFSPERKAAFVYRGDENSRAYRWYKKMGYSNLLPIISYKINFGDYLASDLTTKVISHDELYKWDEQLFACFIKNNGMYGGYPKRRKGNLGSKLAHHYYKEYYAFDILTFFANNNLIAYTVLGRTTIRDRIDRIEIMEFSIPAEEYLFDSILNEIKKFSIQKNIEELRIQLSAQDPFAGWIKKRKFNERYRFNVMGKIIDPVSFFRDRIGNGVDLEREWCFILETPVLGINHIGTGKKNVKIYMEDEQLNLMLLNRCHVRNADEEGKILILEGESHGLDILEQTFPFCKWRFFQIDYI